MRTPPPMRHSRWIWARSWTRWKLPCSRFLPVLKSSISPRSSPRFNRRARSVSQPFRTSRSPRPLHNRSRRSRHSRASRPSPSSPRAFSPPSRAKTFPFRQRMVPHPPRCHASFPGCRPACNPIRCSRHRPPPRMHVGPPESPPRSRPWSRRQRGQASHPPPVTQTNRSCPFKEWQPLSRFRGRRPWPPIPAWLRRPEYSARMRRKRLCPGHSLTRSPRRLCLPASLLLPTHQSGQQRPSPRRRVTLQMGAQPCPAPMAQPL